MSKVLIGIPIRGVHDEPSHETKQCLEALKASSKHAIEITYARGQQITQNSLSLCSKMLSEGWDYLLYTGDDITFPPWALDRMIDHGVDIVGGVCVWKTNPLWVPAVMESNGGYKNFMVTPKMVEQKAMIELDGIGSGFMLISRKALESADNFLRDKVYRAIPEEYRWMCPVPYFPVTYDPDRHTITGSDFSFCRLAKHAGNKIFLDCGVVCGHLWTRPFTVQDHWDWLDANGFSTATPRYPGEPVEHVNPPKDRIYWGPDVEPLDITVTSMGNEYHALNHVSPILLADFVEADHPESADKTKVGYIIGMHGHMDDYYDRYMNWSKRFEKVLVHWVGSDIMNIALWCDDKRKAHLGQPKFVHIVEDERGKKELAPYFDAHVVPIPTEKEYVVAPLPQNFQVAVYYARERHDLHNGDILKGVVEAMPDVSFKFYHINGSQPDFEYPNLDWLGFLDEQKYLNLVGRSSCTIRILKHDGRPFGPIEFATMGRRFVTNTDMEYGYRVPENPTVEDVVKALREIEKEAEPDEKGSAFYKAQNNHYAYREKIQILAGLKEPQAEAVPDSDPEYQYRDFWESRYDMSGYGQKGDGGPAIDSKEVIWLENQIRRAIKANNCKTVLDIGCGSMTRSKELWVDAEHYTGVDVSAQAVRYASQKFPEGTFFVADLTTDTLPLADAVVVQDVLAHIKPGDVAAALDKVFKVAQKVVIIKTSVRIKNALYQFAHDWDGLLGGVKWHCAKSAIPENDVADLLIFTPKEAPVVV